MKKKAHIYRYKGVSFGSHVELNEAQLESLEGLLHGAELPSTSCLGGRGSTFATVTPPFGRVVVKQYRRGGLLGRLIVRHYLRMGVVRAEHEYRLLRRVRELGVRAPEPLVFASKGLFFYQNWLITREIPDSKSLAELSLNQEHDVIQLTQRVVEPVLKLIAHRICHVDLHPGNVLVGIKGEPYLLDFDKAHYYKGSKRALRDFYLRRWRRAVIKHHLPEAISEVMCLKLKSATV